MKNILYRLLLVVSFFASSFTEVEAQYYFTADSSFVLDDTDNCSGLHFRLMINAYTPALKVQSFFGDGTSAVNSVSPASTGVRSQFSHLYGIGGTYSVKHLLLNGTARVDSIFGSHEYLHCETFCMKLYQDANSNCVYDSVSEGFLRAAFTVEASRNGVPIDTIESFGGGFYYTAAGVPNDVFGFRILSLPAGASVACPSSGVIYDTLHHILNDHVVKYFGLQCSGTAPFDISIVGGTRAAAERCHSGVLVSNASCTAQNATLVMYASPKYGTTGFMHPPPTSVVGHTVTWNLTGLSHITPQDSVYAGLKRRG